MNGGDERAPKERGDKMKAKERPKAVLGFTRMTANELLARCNTVYPGITTNSVDYANPPMTMVEFKSQIDRFSYTIAAAFDGSKQAIAERNRQGQVMID